MKTLIFEGLNYAQNWFKGTIMRNFGVRLYKLGLKIEGNQASEDRLVPSLRKVSYGGFQPMIQQCDFIAPNAVIMGNVKIGYKSSVWYASTINGTTPIEIGNNSVIQDRVHLSHNIKIGDHVFIGPNTIIQNSLINNRGFISMGASLRNVTVERGGFVAAGAVLQQNTIVKQGQIWAGNPAKMIRLITPLERQILRQHLQQMQDLACMHDEQTQKTSRQILDSETLVSQPGTFDDFMEDVLENNLNYSDMDDEFVEQRVLMKQKLEFPQLGQDYQPYQYDMQHFGQKFNIGVHTQEFKKVATKIKSKENFPTDQNPWKTPF